ncbi:MAG: amidohydrolase [Anaerolineaceae bacterium]|nr:amidohydrolase [Anaerolineaceae bacterium]
MPRTLIKAGTVLTMDDQRGVLSPGHLLIDGAEIVAVGPPEEIPQGDVERVIDFSGRLVMPGLVNAHAHTPMSLFRGLAEGISLFTMDGFINCLRRLEAAADSSMVPAAVEVSCAEMIRTGTTCFADQYFYMRDIYPVVDRSGLRAALAYGIVELGDEDSRKREIRSVTEFLESFSDHPRIKGWVGPHAFFVDNSEEVIALELELAQRFDTGLHIHFATSSEEEDYCRAKFGISAVERMKQLGILEFPILAAHAITVPESDYATLAESPFTAVICGSSSMRSGFPAAPVKAMRDAGINLALGTDNVANANSYDLFREMDIAAKLQVYRESEPGVIPAKAILEMTTLGGAKALGWEDKIGSLTPGKLADLIALDLTDIGWGPRGAQDLYTAIVYAISGMHVTDVMVDGKWLLQDKKWTTMDYSGAAQQMDADYLRLNNKLENV